MAEHHNIINSNMGGISSNMAEELNLSNKIMDSHNNMGVNNNTEVEEVVSQDNHMLAETLE